MSGECTCPIVWARFEPVGRIVSTACAVHGSEARLEARARRAEQRDARLAVAEAEVRRGLTTPARRLVERGPHTYEERGNIEICVQCGWAREGTISWALRHRRHHVGIFAIAEALFGWLGAGILVLEWVLE